MSTKKNLTDDEIYALCIAVESRHQELFGKAKGPNYKQKKIDAWNALKGDLIAQGFKCFEGKSVDDLRDNVYGYRKRNTETKWNNSRKTGGAGVQWKNWEEVIIRAEKFAEDVSIMEDVGDSGEQLTDWQKNVEKEMKKEESEEKPMISTAASSSTSAAAKELIGETPSLTGGGRSNIPIIQMRNKRQKPNIDLRNPHRTFIQWKRQFGPIYTIHFPKREVVICGAAEMNELLTQPKYADIFADRPTFSFLYGIFSYHQPDGNGIILSRGQIWQKNRRFALSAFRNLGMGRPQMEARIRHHKDQLIERLAALATQDSGIVHDFQPQLAFCYGNVIQDLVMGRHYEQYNHPEFLFFKKFIESTTKEIASLQMLLVDRWPWLRWLFPAYWRYIREGFALQRFLMREVDARIAYLRRQNGIDGPSLLLGEPECFIDAYLDAAVVEGQRIDDPKLKLTVVICAGDLWAGGLETVVTTTWWAALYMLHYPHVQTRLQAELDAQCPGRAFMLSDRKEMPYFRAVIDELQRVANVLPWNVPHSTSQQVKFHGWTLPKDTIVQVQLGAVHLDEANFPEPDIFRPERFLDENGKYKQSELLKPFGMGRRSCMGESLVKMELPIVLASLLQNFNIKPIPREPLPSLRRNPGIVSTPDPFKFIIQKRHEELILD